MKLYKVKKTAGAFAVGLMIATSAPTMAGGIPVIDPAQLAQSIQQGIQLGQQIQNQIKQITELKNQVKALTGNRNLGNPENRRT